MVKFHQLSCLTHPVSSVLMDIKWRKFGLVCFFVNFLLFALYMSFIMTMVLTITEDESLRNCGISTSNSNSTEAPSDDGGCENAIQLMFKKGPIYALIAVYIIIVSAFNLLKEIFQVFDEGISYFFSINNWLEVSLYVTAVVALMKEVSAEKSEMAACVFLLWFVALLYLSKFNYLGLYIVMIRKILSTALKVLPLLLVFLAAFAFGFYVILVNEKNSFRSPIEAMAFTFVMMLDTVTFDKIQTSQDKSLNTTSTNSFVFYILYFSFCFMMPIIFLNLLIGLAVGDIDKIRRTAALERYTSQVEHLSQLERALPAFILKRVQVSYHLDYPNRRKAWKDKIVDFLVGLLSPRDEGVGSESPDESPHEKKQEALIKESENRHPRYEDMKDLIASLKEDILSDIREQLSDNKKYTPAKKESRAPQTMDKQQAEFIFV